MKLLSTIFCVFLVAGCASTSDQSLETTRRQKDEIIPSSKGSTTREDLYQDPKTSMHHDQIWGHAHDNKKDESMPGHSEKHPLHGEYNNTRMETLRSYQGNTMKDSLLSRKEPHTSPNPGPYNKYR